MAAFGVCVCVFKKRQTGGQEWRPYTAMVWFLIAEIQIYSLCVKWPDTFISLQHFYLETRRISSFISAAEFNTQDTLCSTLTFWLGDSRKRIETKCFVRLCSFRLPRHQGQMNLLKRCETLQVATWGEVRITAKLQILLSKVLNPPSKNGLIRKFEPLVRFQERFIYH